MALTGYAGRGPSGVVGVAVALAALTAGCGAGGMTASPASPVPSALMTSAALATPPIAGPVATSAQPPPALTLAPAAAVPKTPAVPKTAVVPKTAPAPAATSSTSPPVRVTIPSIGVDSGLDKLGVDRSGILVPPATWGRAGWFSAGTIPGDVGPALIAGHIDSTSGPAVFAKLSTLKPGALVIVTEADGKRLTFEVDSGRSYPKTAFPTSVVYGPTPLRALRLVTCTGTFDHATGHYLDNYIAYAHLVA